MHTLMQGTLTAALYALLSASLYNLFARDTITRRLQAAYPNWLAYFMYCPACTGTWYGAALAALGGYGLDLPFLVLRGDAWYTVVVVGLLTKVTTPLIAYRYALAMTGIERLDQEPVDVAAVVDAGLEAATTPMKRPLPLRAVTEDEPGPGPRAA